jgi:hypothetical protein
LLKLRILFLQIKVPEHRNIVVMMGEIGSHLNTQENYKGKTLARYRDSEQNYASDVTKSVTDA